VDKFYKENDLNTQWLYVQIIFRFYSYIVLNI